VSAWCGEYRVAPWGRVAEAVGPKKKGRGGRKRCMLCCRPPFLFCALIAATVVHRRRPSPLPSLPLLRHTQMPASSPVGRRQERGKDFDLFLLLQLVGGGRKKTKVPWKVLFLILIFWFALGERSIRGTRMFQAGRGPCCSPAANPWGCQSLGCDEIWEVGKGWSPSPSLPPSLSLSLSLSKRR